MSLKVLEGVDTPSANEALATTILALNSKHSVPDRLTSLSLELVQEARQRLKLDARLDETSANAAIRHFLTEELDRRLFLGRDRKAIRDRLGASGELPLGGYEITFAEHFDQRFKRENKRFVRECLRVPDLYQHILDPQTEGGAQASLFCKLSREKGRAYWILLYTSRTNTELTVHEVLRLFPETVKLRDDVSPLGLFRSFLDAYGVEIYINRIPTGKALFNAAEDHSEHMGMISIKDDGSDVIFDVLMDKNRVVFAYAYALRRYLNDCTKYS